MAVVVRVCVCVCLSVVRVCVLGSERDRMRERESEREKAHASSACLIPSLHCLLFAGLESRDRSGHFVSSVCWARRSNVVLAANSVGAIKVLSLV